MTAKRQRLGYIVAALLGMLAGSFGAYLHTRNLGLVGSLIFAGIVGFMLGAIWRRPGSGIIGALAAFGLWTYLVPYLVQLIHS